MEPDWKKGPTYGEPTSTEHAISPEDFGQHFDLDGFGRDEAEMVDGDPLVAIQEVAQCSREGCEAAHRRRLLFTTQPLSEKAQYVLRTVSGPDGPSAYAFDHATRVGPETIQVGSMEIQAEHIVDDEPTGACHGTVQPDPEPQWRDI
jgi:hypothetical protein